MTVYVDNFHTIEASRSTIDSIRRANMIATNLSELRRFARIVVAGCQPTQTAGRYELTAAAQMRAVLLGAVQVEYQTLWAMYCLQLMGFDMGRPSTARERRRKLALEVEKGEVI